MPEPIAPRKSAITDKPPIHSPPNAAAVGMYLKRKKEREKKSAYHLLKIQERGTF